MLKFSELPNYYDNQSKIAAYRKLAGIGDDVEITEYNLDRHALEETAVLANEGFSRIEDILLGRVK